MPKPSGSNKENLERTRTHLLATAKICFAKYGYAETSTNLIIEDAKSSRGSLYHHFTDKKAIFKAVYDLLYLEVAERISNYPYKRKTSLDDLVDGCTAYLKIFTEQTFARIILIDAPHVLGMEYCRSRDAETSYKTLYEGVLEIIKSKQRSLLVTDFLSGALDTYALRIAMASDKERVFNLYRNGFRELACRIIVA